MRKRRLSGDDRVEGTPAGAESLSAVAVQNVTVAGSVAAQSATGEIQQPSNAAVVRQFAETYYGDVYRYSYRLSGTAAEAEDLTQQTFLMALQRVHQLRDPSRAKAWLFAVLRSCFLKGCRKRVPTAAVNLELDIGLIPEEISDLEVDSERLQNALNDLPDDFRLVLVMFYFDQCSYKEIASELGIAKGTVMSRLARAKRQLRYKLVSSGGTVAQMRE